MIPKTSKGRITSKIALNVAKDVVLSKGEDVVLYDVKKITPDFSYLIICSASSNARINSIQFEVEESLNNYYKKVKSTSNRNSNGWSVVDGYDIVVHIMSYSERQRVDMDALYVKCPHKVITEKTKVPHTRCRDDYKKKENEYQ